MKKILFSVAVAALAFASCEKEDVIQQKNVSMDNAIEVTAIVDADAESKASAVVTSQSNIGSFKMYIYNDNVAVAENVTFTKPAKAGDPWTHDGIYYWAKGEYELFGLAQDNSASNAISKVSVNKDGITIGSNTDPYVITTDGATNRPYWSGTAYEGGIYEDAVSSTSQPDPVIAVETCSRDENNEGTSVTTMRFYHALSRVRVQLNSYDPKTSKLKLVVVGYEFRQVGVEGYTTSAIATHDAAVSPAWTIKTKGMVRENSVAIPSAYNNTAWTGTSKSLIPSDSWCNIIPGTLATAIVVKAALYDSNGKYVATRYLTTAKTDVMSASSVLTSYQPGYQYTYKVQVTSDAGDDTDNPNPGVDDPTHDGPDSGIEGLTIKITSVTVEAWKDTNGGTAVFTGK